MSFKSSLLKSIKHHLVSNAPSVFPPSCFLPPTKLPKKSLNLPCSPPVLLIHYLVWWGDLQRLLSAISTEHFLPLFHHLVTGPVHYWMLLPPSTPLASAMTLAPWTSADYSDHPFSVPYSPSSFAHVLMLVNPRFYSWSTSFPIAYVLSRYSSTVTYLEAEDLPICISSLDLSSKL